MKIVVVSPNDAYREAVQKRLAEGLPRSGGKPKILSAKTAELALALAKGKLDLVLLDVLGNNNVGSISRIFREKTPKAKLILTGGSTTRDRALMAGHGDAVINGAVHCVADEIAAQL